MTRPGFGYVRDDHDPNDYSAAFLTGRETAAPVASLVPYIVEVLDQGAASSCTTHAVASAIQILQKKADPDGKHALTNRLMPYWDGRVDPQLDNGAQPRRIFQAYREMGYCPDRDWAYHPSKVGLAPPPRLRAKSYPKVNKLGFYRCDDEGGVNRVDQIRKGLSIGQPGVLGVHVDQPFVQYRGGIWTYRGPLEGRHYITAVGYTPEYLEVLNSWGEHTGIPDHMGRFRGGFLRLSWDMVANPEFTTDVYLLTYAPEAV